MSLVEFNKENRIESEFEHHLFWDELQSFKESNPFGYAMMIEFMKRLMTSFLDIQEQICFVARGQPYAPFNIHYTVAKINPNDENGYTKGKILIGIIMYPAGFKLRPEDMFRDLTPCCLEIRSHVERCLGSEENVSNKS